MSRSSFAWRHPTSVTQQRVCCCFFDGAAFNAFSKGSFVDFTGMRQVPSICSKQPLHYSTTAAAVAMVCADLSFFLLAMLVDASRSL